MKLKFTKISGNVPPKYSRHYENRPLTGKEIEFLKGEINSIKADGQIFVFNDSGNMRTGYDPVADIVYVSGTVFGTDNFNEVYSLCWLTPKAALAYEYYGRRPERKRYLKECENEIAKMPPWEDAARAFLNAALNTPNLSQFERIALIHQAGSHAENAGQTFELTQDLKDIIFATWENAGDRDYIPIASTIRFIAIGDIKKEGKGS